MIGPNEADSHPAAGRVAAAQPLFSAETEPPSAAKSVAVEKRPAGIHRPRRL